MANVTGGYASRAVLSDASSTAGRTMRASSQMTDIATWRRWIDGPIKASGITMNHHRQDLARR
jgi:hypothetical protein